MLLFAPTIHQGGGKILLDSLLAQKDHGIKTIIFDSRLKSDALNSVPSRYAISPGIFGRLHSELLVWHLSRKHRQILCFGNLPPLFPTSTKVDIFFQNALILNSSSQLHLPMSVYTKYLLERFWLKLRSKNIRKVWIQSETLRDQFKKKFPHIPTGLTPFASQPIQNTNWDTPSCDFLYPASDAPHKNHLNLFKAWEILADGGLYPSLYVTIPKNGNLNREIERLQKNGVQIVNLSEITHDQTLYLLKKSRALIFPSFLESFGLPIIEANYFNIPILASELDYVRDFSSPVQTFDPHSSKSIARAVKRFLERKNDLIQHPITASEFLNQVQRDFI